MPDLNIANREKFDKTNAFLAGMVFIISLIVYALTVQRTLSFWDCGEFIACAYMLGIPHPPGTPLFVLLGRVISLIPFVEDISYRINYLSVISSALTAMFSYLLTVRLVQYLFDKKDNNKLNRYIAYIGGIAGGLFVAFGRTNWSNSVEAEVYGLALALSVMIVWLTIKFFEQRGTMAASKTMIMIFYLAVLGIGIHMTVYLVAPICSIFFILKKEATQKDWLYLCGFIILELLLIVLFANGRGGTTAFYLVSFFLGATLMTLLYKKINWTILLAIVSVSTVMYLFSIYLIVTPITFGILIVLAILSKKYNWNLRWRSAMGIVLIGVIGMSIHLYIPIRSTLNPRIDENNPSRNLKTFVDFLDRKQYGKESMIERMFMRRGAWSNQFGRHPHMGYWSYFEEQYSKSGWTFIIPFFLLGVIGLVAAIRKRLEIGLPFMTLFLVCSVGLILYMNFADGTKYNFNTGDAYLEVRNRDYFFTPAFIFFGIAMGVGVSAVMKYLKDKFSSKGPAMQKTIVYASSILLVLPGVTLGHNYHASNRSQNYIPYDYAVNILNTCEPNSILFTSGDNDTFPVWCVQEVYDYRKDVRVVNLSLLNTDWYVDQMKNRYDVPISLTEEQILWYDYDDKLGSYKRPREMFIDRTRRRKTYLWPTRMNDQTVKVQDMMVDEIIIESLVKKDSGYILKQPIYFSGLPYAESPLNLREKIVSSGILYKLEMGEIKDDVDIEKSYDLFMNTYKFRGYESSVVYRDENATGVTINTGATANRIVEELIKMGEKDKAVGLAEKIIESYPEYWQTYVQLADFYKKEGDTSKTVALLTQLRDTLVAFYNSNPENLFYLQDYGLTEVYLGQETGNQAQIDKGINLLWEAYNRNQNSSHAFRKLVTILAQNGRYTELREAAEKFAEYKINLTDGFLQQILGFSNPRNAPTNGGG